MASTKSSRAGVARMTNSAFGREEPASACDRSSAGRGLFICGIPGCQAIQRNGRAARTSKG
jgi:hypothetical protein